MIGQGDEKSMRARQSRPTRRQWAVAVLTRGPGSQVARFRGPARTAKGPGRRLAGGRRVVCRQRDESLGSDTASPGPRATAGCRSRTGPRRRGPSRRPRPRRNVRSRGPQTRLARGSGSWRARACLEAPPTVMQRGVDPGRDLELEALRLLSRVDEVLELRVYPVRDHPAAQDPAVLSRGGSDAEIRDQKGGKDC